MALLRTSSSVYDGDGLQTSDGIVVVQPICLPPAGSSSLDGPQPAQTPVESKINPTEDEGSFMNVVSNNLVILSFFLVKG